MVRIQPHWYAGLPTLDGRPVYTRARLVELYNIGLSTLEGYYRERETTGHPETVGAIDRAKAWDAEEWDDWWSKFTDTSGLISLDGAANKYGRRKATTISWWGERQTNGHPGERKRIGKTIFFDADEYDDWYWATKAPPGVSGEHAVDPDELVDGAGAERLLGMAKGSIYKYLKQPPDGFPNPDPKATTYTASGRPKYKWRAHAILEYGRTRGRHGGGRPAGPRVARRYPYDGDLRLQIARDALRDLTDREHRGDDVTDDRRTLPVTLSQQHGGAPGTWANILSTARQHPTDHE